MTYDEYDNPYDPYDRGVIRKLPKSPYEPPGPGVNTYPEDTTPHPIPVDTAAPTPDRPPKPDDPGDGRVWIWMGDHWGLTEPANAPYPSSGQRQGGDRPAFDYAPPQWEFPTYESAGEFTPRRSTFDFTKFEANPFIPSTWADAEAEPGYAESQANLMKQIEAGAAAQGMLRSGMTLKNEAYGLNDFKQQNFRNFDDRRYRNWTGNEGNRFNAWKGNLDADQWKFATEYGIDKDVFQAHATDIDRKNNYQFNVSDARFKDSLARWQTMVDSLTRISTNPV